MTISNFIKGLPPPSTVEYIWLSWHKLYCITKIPPVYPLLFLLPSIRSKSDSITGYLCSFGGSFPPLSPLALPAPLFAVPPRLDLIHRVVCWFRAGERRGWRRLKGAGKSPGVIGRFTLKGNWTSSCWRCSEHLIVAGGQIKVRLCCFVHVYLIYAPSHISRCINPFYIISRCIPLIRWR